MPTTYPDDKTIQSLKQKIQDCKESDYKEAYQKMKPTGFTRHQFARVWFAMKSQSMPAPEVKPEFYKTPEAAIEAKEKAVTKPVTAAKE